jgi:hypothetical protein
VQPENFAFGGGAAETVLHPLAAVWMFIAIVLILTLPRNRVIVPFLLSFFTIPLGQVIVLGGLHFPVLRILILVGLARVIAHRTSSSEGAFPGGFNALDTVVVLWAVSALVVVSLQWMEPRAFIKFGGDFLDALGGYVVARFLIRDVEALRRTVKVLAFVCAIQGVCMLAEQFTNQNVFSVFGAYPPEMREGHIRAQGVMGSLYGGSFAGVLIPLFLWLWTENKSRMAACLGLGGATLMVFASHASTSWLAYGMGLVGLAFWPLRKQMRLVRWGIVAMLVGLHLVMHGPVWSLIEHVDVTGGSSSYHRYMLVDNCIRHFSDWWLLGYKNYGSWGFDMWDLCNQFVVAALTGGLITLVLFIMIYSRSFGAIGEARKQVSGEHKQEWLLWCLGAVMFANVVASFGINYMVQLQTALFALLACISVATFAAKQAAIQEVESTNELLLASAPQTTVNYLPLREVR